MSNHYHLVLYLVCGSGKCKSASAKDIVNDGTDYLQALMSLNVTSKESFLSLMNYNTRHSDPHLAKTPARHQSAYSGDGDRHFRGNVTDRFNLFHWRLKRNVSGHDQSTFAVFSGVLFWVFLRMESPINCRRCAPFKSRSRMAPATVASPM